MTEALRGREASGVVLVAPAAVMHALKAAIPHDVQGAVQGEHAGDLTQIPTADLFARLDEFRRGG
jgi:hypothetical protein